MLKKLIVVTAVLLLQGGSMGSTDVMIQDPSQYKIFPPYNPPRQYRRKCFKKCCGKPLCCKPCRVEPVEPIQPIKPIQPIGPPHMCLHCCGKPPCCNTCGMDFLAIEKQ